MSKIAWGTTISEGPEMPCFHAVVCSLLEPTSCVPRRSPWQQFCNFRGVFFSKIGQNGRPGRREPPRSISFDETSRMVPVWGRRQKVIFAVFCIVVGKNQWPACENLEKNYARAHPAFPKLEKRSPKVGGFAADFACGFFEFWRGGARSRIVFL